MLFSWDCLFIMNVWNVYMPVFCPHFHFSPFSVSPFAWTPVVWRCNSLPLCVVRITTMAHPLPPPHPPLHPPKPSFPAWSLTAWCAAPFIPNPQRSTLPTARAPLKRTAPPGATAACRQTGCSSNVTTAGGTWIQNQQTGWRTSLWTSSTQFWSPDVRVAVLKSWAVLHDNVS